MKPIVTWVLLADSREARVVANEGVGKGFIPLKGGTWKAPPSKPHEDAQGVSHSSVGASQHRLAPRNASTDGDDDFARDVAGKLTKHLKKREFERLIVVADPNMLGHLRRRFDGPLSDVVVAEVAKDLTHVPIGKLAGYLADVIAA